MRFTTETDTPKVRAMVGAFRPASNDARTKFAFPSGISAILAASLDADTGPGRGRRRSLVGFARRTALFAPIDLRPDRGL